MLIFSLFFLVAGLGRRRRRRDDRMVGITKYRKPQTQINFDARWPVAIWIFMYLTHRARRSEKKTALERYAVDMHEIYAANHFRCPYWKCISLHEFNEEVRFVLSFLIVENLFGYFILLLSFRSNSINQWCWHQQFQFANGIFHWK